MTRCTIDTNDNRQVAYPVQPRRSLWGKVPFKKPITVAWSSCRLVLSLKDRRRTSTPDKPSTDISREAAPKVRCHPHEQVNLKKHHNTDLFVPIKIASIKQRLMLNQCWQGA